MRITLTGHTGFKGSWLSLLLRRREATLSGMSLDPEEGSLFSLMGLSDDFAVDVRGDIRDVPTVRSVVAEAQPELLFHLAAQPLVRESYRNPQDTMTTNVTGTMNVLDAAGQCPSLAGQVIVTTDKVYRNVGKREGYVESDPLGGHDPYSASKAMADLLAQSWASSFDVAPMAIARAGNVIGGGDISQDRLLPDLMAAFADGRTAKIRYPNAVRPWQHVLDCLNGYLLVSEALLAGRGEGAWNFGPPPQNEVTVGDVADLAARLWGPDARWEADGDDHPHEAAHLTLDSTKARTELNWRDRLDVSTAIEWVVEWHQRVLAGEGARTVTVDQVNRFEESGD